jgi:flagellar L-ring protein precursor FlgH
MNRDKRVLVAAVVFLLGLGLPLQMWGGKGSKQATPPLNYVETSQMPAPTPGSLFVPQGGMADLASDYKAHNVNDLIMIRIVESTTADTQGNLASKRQFQNSAGITGLFGQLKTSNSLQQLFNAQSSNQLQGQADSSSTSTLNTLLAGRVVQVLPNGTLVVEASRDIEMNNQRHLATVRGLVRPGDIAADNSVLSTQVSDLQVAIKGKGVVSDATSPPNLLVRWLLKIVNF